jgi:hypothetical protein
LWFRGKLTVTPRSLRGQKQPAWLAVPFKYKKISDGKFFPKDFWPRHGEFSTNMLKSVWKRLRGGA